MKILYFDCFSGISGDMILGALFDAGLNFDAFINELKKLPLEGYEIKISKTTKNSISGTAFNLINNNDSGHRHLKDIIEIVEKSNLNNNTKDKAKIMFTKLAEVESRIHKTPIEEVHFHELGGIDTIIDIVGTLIGLDLLGVESIISSSLPLGKGLAKTEHGLLPIPAPATIELLKNVPVYNNNIEGELVTPTGAVLISSLSDTFGEIPKIKISSIGYGAGKMDLPIPNLLRVYIGEEIINIASEKNCVIEANIDDMNPQIYEYVVDKLFQNGALDVFLTPIIMKKGRPGIIVTIITNQLKEKELIDILFRETTTIGYRKYYVEKTFLKRDISELETKWGKVRVKMIKHDSILRYSPEYEDCKKIAKENKLPLKDVIDSINMLINKFLN